MAQAVAVANGFRCVMTQTTQLVSETQASESDFNFLNRMAAKIGFRFWCSGGTLYFIDPQVLMTGFPYLMVPTYYINLNQVSQDTARLFEKTQGGNLPGAVIAQRQTSGFDQKTGNIVTTTVGASGAPVLVYTDRVVQSYAEGQTVISAKQSLSQFWITATVEVFGNIMLYPGKMIKLDGDAMPYESAGEWLISGAQHILAPGGTSLPQNDRYVTKLTMLRNIQAMPTLKGVQRIQPEFVPCVVTNGKWRSTKLYSITDGIVSTNYVSAQ
jgi:hypothetical protein